MTVFISTIIIISSISSSWPVMEAVAVVTAATADLELQTLKV